MNQYLDGVIDMPATSKLTPIVAIVIFVLAVNHYVDAAPPTLDESQKAAAERRKQMEEIVRKSNEANKTLRDKSMCLSGVDTANGILERLYREYRKNNVDAPVNMEYRGGGNDIGISALAAGEVEAAIIREPMSKSEKEIYVQLYNEHMSQYASKEIGQLVLVIIVNKDNQLSGLTIQQLEDIYRGKIVQWDDVNKAKGKIVRVGTDYPKLSWNMFLQLVLNNNRVKLDDLPFRPEGYSEDEYREFQEKQREKYKSTDGKPYMMYLYDDKVIKEVAKNKYAIGYCLLPAEKDIPKDVQCVPIICGNEKEPISPTRENIFLSKYPLQITLKWMISQKASQACKQFVEYVGSKEAMPLLCSSSVFPYREKIESISSLRLADLKAGKGPKASILGLPKYDQFEKDLAVDYVKSRALLQTDYKLGSDQQAIAAFVNNPTSDMLILEGSASDAAIKPVKDKWDDMVAKGMQKHILASRSVTIVVNSVNKLDSLTLDQIRDIFTGKISDWNIIGKDLVPAGTGDVSSPVFVSSNKPSPDARRGMVLYGLANPIPGTPGNIPDPYYAVLTRAIGQSKLESYQAKKDSTEVLSAVSIDPAGIGFVDASQLIAAAGKGIKVLAIGEPGKTILPQYKAILDGSYPLSEPITLYFMPKPDPAGTTQPATTQPAATNPADLPYKIINMPTSQPAMTPAQTKADFVAFIVSGEPVDTFRKHGLVCQGMEIIPPPPATKPAIEPAKNPKDKPKKPSKPADSQPAKPDLPVWK